MRVREISYSKKIGLPNYGSIGLTVTAELETNDAFDEAYHGLRALVDNRIDAEGQSGRMGNGRTASDPGSTEGRTTPPKLDAKQQVNRESRADNASADKMTEGQRKYLYRLLSDQGYQGQEITERLKSIFNVRSLNQISKKAASTKIDELVKQTA